MNYTKLIAACGAAFISSVSVGVIASAVGAKTPSAVVYAPDPDRVTKRVSYADLNLASAAGSTTLNRRVGYAVSSLCEGTVGSRIGPYRLAFDSCKSVAMTGAEPQIASAVARAQEIAATGQSSIAAAAITITLPQ